MIGIKIPMRGTLVPIWGPRVQKGPKKLNTRLHFGGLLGMKADLGTILGLFRSLPGAFWITFGPHCFWVAFSAPFLTFPGRQNVRFSWEK